MKRNRIDILLFFLVAIRTLDEGRGLIQLVLNHNPTKLKCVQNTLRYPKAAAHTL